MSRLCLGGATRPDGVKWTLLSLLCSVRFLRYAGGTDIALIRKPQFGRLGAMVSGAATPRVQLDSLESQSDCPSIVPSASQTGPD